MLNIDRFNSTDKHLNFVYVPKSKVMLSEWSCLMWHWLCTKLITISLGLTAYLFVLHHINILIHLFHRKWLSGWLLYGKFLIYYFIICLTKVKEPIYFRYYESSGLIQPHSRWSIRCQHSTQL